MQPDHFQFLASKAFAWNAPLTVVVTSSKLTRHPRTDDNLQVLKRWSDARSNARFTETQRAAIRDPAREFWLVDDPTGESAAPILVEVKKIASDPTRCEFTYPYKDRLYTVTWNPSDSTPIQTTGRGADATGSEF